MNTSNGVELLMVVTDCQALWPHNEWVINDELIDAAVQRGLGNAAVTVGEEADGAQPHPRLVMVKEDLTACSLIEALVRNVLWYMHEPCDRCQRQCQPVSRLWVPAGGSVVQVECCADCQRELDDDYPDLVWR